MVLSTQKDILKALHDNYILNANDISFVEAYEVCANKERLYKLANPKKEVIFGRRGTGKTIILKAFTHYINSQLYFTDFKESRKQFAVYINIDQLIPSEELAKMSNFDDAAKIEIFTSKILNCVKDSFFEQYERYHNINLSIKKIKANDNLADCILEFAEMVENKNEILKRIDITITEDTSSQSNKDSSAGIEIGNSTNIVDFIKNLFSFRAVAKKSKRRDKSRIREVKPLMGYDFQVLSQKIRKIAELFQYDRLYICVDELTFINKNYRDIQLQIAQILKDLFFGSTIVTMKAAAHWNISKLQSRNNMLPRIGMELNEDYTAAFDLDTMFIENEDDAKSYFLEMIINQCLLHYSNGNNLRIKESLSENILSFLFGNEASHQEFMFKFLICGSHGVSRSFCNILNKCLDNVFLQNRTNITYEILYDSIHEEYNYGVRRKIEYENPLVDIFDSHLTEKKVRFFMLKNQDYNLNKEYIDKLVDKNYMNQYPSAKLPRDQKNTYKMYVYHLGNYLEASGEKDKKRTISEFDLFPTPPHHDNVSDYLLSLSEPANK